MLPSLRQTCLSRKLQSLKLISFNILMKTVKQKVQQPIQGKFKSILNHKWLTWEQILIKRFLMQQRKICLRNLKKSLNSKDLQFRINRKSLHQKQDYHLSYLKIQVVANSQKMERFQRLHKFQIHQEVLRKQTSSTMKLVHH